MTGIGDGDTDAGPIRTLTVTTDGNSCREPDSIAGGYAMAVRGDALGRVHVNSVSTQAHAVVCGRLDTQADASRKDGAETILRNIGGNALETVAEARGIQHRGAGDSGARIA